MNRTLIAAALALLPGTALASNAAAFDGAYAERTYELRCNLNANDGESLKSRVMVMNSTGRVIPQGTRMDLTFRSPHTRRDFKVKHTAWRDVQPGAGIGFDPPAFRASYCTASVTFSNLAKIKKYPKFPR